MEIPDSVLITFIVVRKCWGKAYRKLWFEVQEKLKEEGKKKLRNPNKKEQEEKFLSLFDTFHSSSNYEGVQRENLFGLFEYFKSFKENKKPFVNPNQVYLVFTEFRPVLGRVITNGSLDEEIRITTGFYASKNTKKYSRLKRGR